MNDVRDFRDGASGAIQPVQAAVNIVNSVGLLAQAGAQHFLISNLPDLGLTPEAALLGLALTPMSAIAVVLVENTAHYYPEFGQRLAAVVMSAVLMLELVAPLLTQLALRSAGEAHPGAPWG